LFNKLGDVKNSDKNLFKYKELINANRSRIWKYSRTNWTRN
jgi:hypothetical protein